MLRWSPFPFVRYFIGLSIGIVVYLFVQNNIDYWLCLFGMALGGLAVLTFRRGSQAGLKGVPGWLALVSLGGLLTHYRTAATDPANLIHHDGAIESYEAVVGTPAEHRTKTYRLELRLRRIRTAAGWERATGRLIVYIDKAVVPTPRYGDVWLVKGAPRPIDPPLNPGEFNYKRHLAYRGIYHQQYLRPADRLVLGDDPPNPLTALAYRVNDWADAVFRRHLPHQQEFAIVKAMVLGVRDTIDPELQQAYSVAGAVHVLSVSGLHVGVLFATLSFLLAFLKKGKQGKYVFACLMLVVLWFYALMTGFSAPVLRSAVMFSLVLVGQTIGRGHQVLNTLAASAFFILLFDPYALTTAGFQLSYLAVGGLALWHRRFYQSLTLRYRWADWLWNSTAVALVAQLVTFPLGVYYFHQFPTYFWLANPAVIPLSSLVLILAMGLLAVSWIPPVAVGVGVALDWTMWLLNQTVGWTEKLPFSVIKPVTLDGLELGLVYGLILMGLLLLTERTRRYGWGMVLASLLLAGSAGWATFQRQRQRMLIVHFVPHQSAMSLINGQSAVLISPRALTADSREVRFYVQNTWDEVGIRAVTYAQAAASDPAVATYEHPDFSLLIWQGKRVLLVNRLSRNRPWRLPAIVDYLIISRNALRDWEQLRGRVVARTLILDDSNKTPLTERLLTEARQRGIQCHSVRQQGAYVVKL